MSNSINQNGGGYVNDRGTFVIAGTEADDKIYVHGRYYKVNDQEWRQLPDEVRNVAVFSGRGNDTVWGAGADLAKLETYGGSGSDTIVGTRYNDMLVSQDGNDRVYGYYGNDVIYAGRGNDYLNAGPGNDRLWGGYGDDILYGGPGNNYLSGGPGRDQYLDNYLGLWGMGPTASAYGSSGYHF